MDQKNRNVVVGVSGGIAAYKACHLIRNFTEAGDNVKVVPTEAALNFVGKATFEALSGNPVSTSVFDAVDEVRHVHIGQNADLVVVAPATADLLARVAAGRADDLLAATILVATCPVVLAPAMHTEMWENPATQANVATLRSRGITVLAPAHGRLTGKDTGAGRLPEPEQIADLARVVSAGESLQQSLADKRVLVTTGGTREAIDPVRFIGNHSSGRQGYALAEIAAHRGARVTVVAAATEKLLPPSGAEVISVRSAREMQSVVFDLAPDMDIIVMAAAVADFRPEEVATTKMKKGHETEGGLRHIQLVENPDILKGLVELREAGDISLATSIVGFAAETGDDQYSALDYARAKITKKGCDLLMCNEVGDDKVFGKPENEGFLIDALGNVTEIPVGTKHQVAARILDAVEKLTLDTALN